MFLWWRRRPSAGDAFTQTRTILIAPPKLFSFLFFVCFFFFFLSFSIQKSNIQKIGRSRRSPQGREGGVGAKIDLFPREARGFESKSVIDTRVTMDKYDPFLNMGFKHGKKWVDKNWGKMQHGVRAYD